MSNGISQSDLDALFAGLTDTTTDTKTDAATTGKETRAAVDGCNGISQADLDALFAESPGKTTETADGCNGISQADLDALFAGLTDTCAGASPGPQAGMQLRSEDGGENPPPAKNPGEESMSQDEIDKMLAEFGLG